MTWPSPSDTADAKTEVRRAGLVVVDATTVALVREQDAGNEAGTATRYTALAAVSTTSDACDDGSKEIRPGVKVGGGSGERAPVWEEADASTQEGAAASPPTGWRSETAPPRALEATMPAGDAATPDGENGSANGEVCDRCEKKGDDGEAASVETVPSSPITAMRELPASPTYTLKRASTAMPLGALNTPVPPMVTTGEVWMEM